MIFGKHINRYYIKHLPMLLLGVAALIMVDYAQLVVPEMYRIIVNALNYGEVEIDGVITPFTMDVLLDEVCLPMIFIIIVMIIGRFLWRICFFGSGIKVETDLRRRMFDHSKELSQQYYQVNKVGNMMSLFTNDLETVQDCFGSGILMFCDAAFLGVLAVGKMAKMNLTLTLFTLVPMVFLFIVGTLIGKYMMMKWEVRQAAFSSLSEFSQESFSGIAVVKAFVKEGLELMSFKRLNKDNENANVAYTKISVAMNIFVTLFVESVICIILGYGGYLVHEGVFNAGELVEFIGYFTAIVWPVMAVSQLIEMHSRGAASLKRIGELLDAQPDVIDKPNVKKSKPLKGNISFRGLNFRYPDGDYDALENISFDIKAGESVGLIGKTGAGKTTLVDLLLRTYNVGDGMIYLDGRDINSLPIRFVREHCAYVPQDNFLFSDTIKNNISFASKSKKTKEVTRAAKLSDVHSNIIEFPQKYDTVLGERGVTVSGGQKQRISIARALMKDAPILILDDSVSAVDVKTEQIILDNLKKERKGKTTILIAHRISTIENLDKIVFIDDGKLIAVGAHSELYANCPEYRTMVDLQKIDERKEAMA